MRLGISRCFMLEILDKTCESHTLSVRSLRLFVPILNMMRTRETHLNRMSGRAAMSGPLESLSRQFPTRQLRADHSAPPRHLPLLLPGHLRTGTYHSAAGAGPADGQNPCSSQASCLGGKEEENREAHTTFAPRLLPGPGATQPIALINHTTTAAARRPAPEPPFPPISPSAPRRLAQLILPSRSRPIGHPLFITTTSPPAESRRSFVFYSLDFFSPARLVATRQDPRPDSRSWLLADPLVCLSRPFCVLVHHTFHPRRALPAPSLRALPHRPRLLINAPLPITPRYHAHCATYRPFLRVQFCSLISVSLPCGVALARLSLICPQ